MSAIDNTPLELSDLINRVLDKGAVIAGQRHDLGGRHRPHSTRSDCGAHRDRDDDGAPSAVGVSAREKLMPTYLYCLRSDTAEPPDGLTGVDGSRRARAPGGEPRRVGERRRRRSSASTVERVKAHDAVCAAALESGRLRCPFDSARRFAKTMRR